MFTSYFQYWNFMQISDRVYCCQISVLPNHLSTRPRRVKSCFGRVKNSVIIKELCVCYLSKSAQNGYSDGCHEKFRKNTANMQKDLCNKMVHGTNLHWIPLNIWGLRCQKQVSQAGISNYIPQFTVGCNYLSLPEIPASGNKVFIYIDVKVWYWGLDY